MGVGGASPPSAVNAYAAMPSTSFSRAAARVAGSGTPLAVSVGPPRLQLVATPHRRGGGHGDRRKEERHDAEGGAKQQYGREGQREAQCRRQEQDYRWRMFRARIPVPCLVAAARIWLSSTGMQMTARPMMRTGMQQTNPMVKMTPATHKKGKSTQTHPTSVARPAGEPLACWMPADMVFPTPGVADTPSIMLAKIDVLSPASCSPAAPARFAGPVGRGTAWWKGHQLRRSIQQLATVPPEQQRSSTRAQLGFPLSKNLL